MRCPSLDPITLRCRRLSILLLLFLSVPTLIGLTACSRQPKEAPQIVGGVFAIEGTARIESALDPGFQRTAKAGVGLFSDQLLTVEKEGRVVLEGMGTRFIELGRGRHVLAKLHALNAVPGETRPVQRIGATEANLQDAAPLITTIRYEPLPSVSPQSSLIGKAIEDADMRDGMAFFFLPKSMQQQASADPTVPPWKAQEHRVRRLSRMLKKTSDGRQLIKVKGSVVVEFRDHATAFADKLTLPLDLGDVERVIVLDGGEAMLTLPSGNEVWLESDAEAQISHADAP
ncbi:MAG: hypothetical protein LBM75_05775 [Myxococcales bacterium]|jgi:hypothetical protein|nr:hypothetical protein [Myxococcales bacterium]